MLKCVDRNQTLVGAFREPSVGVRRQEEAEKGTLEQYFHKRGLIGLSVNEGGTAEDFQSFRPLLKCEGWKPFFISFVLRNYH